MNVLLSFPQSGSPLFRVLLCNFHSFLNVDNNTTLNGTLNVKQNVDIDSILNVDGDASFNSELHVENDVSFNNICLLSKEPLLCLKV